MTPITIKDGKGDECQVPCGRCIKCTGRRTSAWSFRLMQQYKIAESAYFITLTYAPKYMTREEARITPKGFQTLNKRDCQLFMKRLRKANPGRTLKYYLAGEYGSKSARPHYHIILFNADINTISKAWDLGEIHFGEVNEASVGYTLKYISKGKTVPVHPNDDRQPEFSLMSKGLGANYLSESIIKYHKADLGNRMYMTLSDGKKISMPRYYKDKIYDEHERIIAANQTRLRMIEERNKMIQKIGREAYDDLMNSQVKSMVKKLNHLKSKPDKL